RPATWTPERPPTGRRSRQLRRGSCGRSWLVPVPSQEGPGQQRDYPTLARVHRRSPFVVQAELQRALVHPHGVAHDGVVDAQPDAPVGDERVGLGVDALIEHLDDALELETRRGDGVLIANPD